jgi:hypothetical protein
MATVNDFFNSKNLIQDCEHLDYDSLAPLIEVADTFARSTYQSIYVIDYYLRNFLYVSPNPLFLCGKLYAWFPSRRIKRLGMWK